jgi:hypothetical protein
VGIPRYTDAGSIVFDSLEAWATIDEIMAWFHLPHEQVVAVTRRWPHAQFGRRGYCDGYLGGLAAYGNG